MATINELANVIGKRGEYQVGKLSFAVVILDAEQSYGQLRYLIQPVAGIGGNAWVNASSVNVED